MVDITISEVAKKLGTDAALLRMWEQRYHWPTPKRVKGVRMFTPLLVQQLVGVRREMAKGRRIGDIIRDGYPDLPTDTPRQPARPKIDFSSVPPPDTEVACKFRAEVEEALLTRNAAALAALAARLPREVRPADRDRAYHFLVRLAEPAVHS
jgi:DNA-binding transcriptional MerR regulator